MIFIQTIFDFRGVLTICLLFYKRQDFFLGILGENVVGFVDYCWDFYLRCEKRGFIIGFAGKIRPFVLQKVR